MRTTSHRHDHRLSQLLWIWIIWFLDISYYIKIWRKKQIPVIRNEQLSTQLRRRTGPKDETWSSNHKSLLWPSFEPIVVDMGSLVPWRMELHQNLEKWLIAKMLLILDFTLEARNYKISIINNRSQSSRHKSILHFSIFLFSWTLQPTALYGECERM